jgi:hypothetical protein
LKHVTSLIDERIELDSNAPRLQLELENNGTGGGRPTAVGLDEGSDDQRKREGVLFEPPCWFRLIDRPCISYFRWRLLNLSEVSVQDIFDATLIPTRSGKQLAKIWKIKLPIELAETTAEALDVKQLQRQCAWRFLWYTFAALKVHWLE